MFRNIFDRYSWEETEQRIYNSGKGDVEASLYRELRRPEDFYPLFSPAADEYLEGMAGLSSKITRMKFGNTIQLYAPLYISNECINKCVYCGFNSTNSIKRVTLTPEKAEAESLLLYERGFRHILLVSGEHRKAVPVDFLSDIVNRIHKRFASVTIEVYPMNSDEYREIIASGADGLTLYQETYNRETYEIVHPAGPKKDFDKRVSAPEMGGDAGFRKIGIGFLSGLTDWRVEGFFTALHAQYLMKKYWKSLIQVSFPRIRKTNSEYSPPASVSDRDLTHLICVMRILLPEAGLVLSTREAPYYRDNIIPLGITMMSAGSSTEPGGYSTPRDAGEQFQIEDTRAPEEVARIIHEKGFDPVWKDWDREFLC